MTANLSQPRQRPKVAPHTLFPSADAVGSYPVAAIDLGSNSFRLEVGQVSGGRYLRTSYLKETVRQGGGLDANRCLTPEAMKAGLDCLSRFAERLRDFDPSNVRAVATQTLREARNREEFIQEASRVLGFPIEIISGREEARLIYLGVSSKLALAQEKRLVIDIGGRSTELILGSGPDVIHLESYRVGSVTWSQRYFTDGQFTHGAFELGKISASAIFDEVVELFADGDWEVAYGSAGTIGAIALALEIAGWPAGQITRDGLDWLVEQLLQAGSADQLQIQGISEERTSIIGGGVSVLLALFDLLGFDALQVAEGGLRHGLLQEMLGAETPNGDQRDASVRALSTLYGQDAAQSERVARTATFLFDQVQAKFPELPDSPLARRQLGWAASLHEIGIRVSHSDYHRHGAYLVENADALGFTFSDLRYLGLLILGQKGKLRKLGDALNNPETALQLLCLRLAVILCHARRVPDIDSLHLARPDTNAWQFLLQGDRRWAEQHPQSVYLLNEEVKAWGRTEWDFQINFL